MTAPVRVAIADDLEDIRSLVRLLFEQDARYEVIGEAEDGLQAIELVARMHPDLLLLDRQMPLMGGIEALPGIRQASPQTHVVLYTAAEEEGTRHAAISAGAIDVLRKDALGVDFTDKLAETLLSHWSDERELQLTVGPVRSEAVLAWVENTRGILDLVREHPTLTEETVGPEVLDLFDRLLEGWEEIARTNEQFVWRATASPAEAAQLLEAWAVIDRIPEDWLSAHGRKWSDPLGREYFDALTGAVLGALEAQEVTSRLAESLREQGWRS